MCKEKKGQNDGSYSLGGVQPGRYRVFAFNETVYCITSPAQGSANFYFPAADLSPRCLSRRDLVNKLTIATKIKK